MNKYEYNLMKAEECWQLMQCTEDPSLKNFYYNAMRGFQYRNAALSKEVTVNGINERTNA